MNKVLVVAFWVACVAFPPQGRSVFPAFKGLESSEILDQLKTRCKTYQEHVLDFKDAIIASQTNLVKNIEALDENVKNSNVLLKDLEALEQGALTAETLLPKVLEKRLDILNSRHMNMFRLVETTYIAQTQKVDMIMLMGSTNPKFRDKLDPVTKASVESSVDLYQTWTAASLGLAAMVGDLTSLPEPTKKLIAVSPALWPRLKGTMDDLGHPDEGILGDGNDVLTDKTDSALFQFHFKHGGKKEITLNGRKKVLQIPLVLPDFLKIQEPVVPQPEKHAKPAKQKHVGKPKSSHKKNPSKRGTVDLQPDPGSQETPSVVEEVIPTVSIPLNIQEERKEEENKEEEDAFQSSSTSPVVARKTPVVIPPQTPEDPISRLGLKGKHLQIWQDIFDPMQFQNIRFQSFQTLWTYLGGEVLTNKGGGSHRTLTFHGKTIGGTFVPHGGGSYGPRCVHQLRDALLALFKKLHPVTG